VAQQARDWHAWHRDYADPSSPLSRRRRVVQSYLRQTLTEVAPSAEGPIRLLSMCAGDGSDVLEVLAAAGGTPRVRALLVELDAELAGRAGEQAARCGLSDVRVITGDAGRTASYAELAPADVVLACGVFGNISDADVRRTVGALPGLLRPGGRVIWTRGRGAAVLDASRPIRELFAEHGFAELDFTAPADAPFRVGLHRLDGTGLDATELPEQLFRFR
jgi:SAM-dependent methyltransferase